MIYFGKVIAYDNLGKQYECQQAIASLFLLIEEEDGDMEPAPGEHLIQEYEQADNILKKLANLARSSQVRDLLLSLVDGMSEPLFPLTKIVDPLVWKG